MLQARYWIWLFLSPLTLTLSLFPFGFNYESQWTVTDITFKILLLIVTCIWLALVTHGKPPKKIFFLCFAGLCLLFHALTLSTLSSLLISDKSFHNISNALLVLGCMLISVGVYLWGEEFRSLIKNLRCEQEKYKLLSITDSLSGLHNSHHFRSLIESEIENSHDNNTPLSLLIMDVDNFKAYNDTYGHLAGDDVIRKIGQTIQRQCRADDMAFRYGGEEFAVILPNTDFESSIQHAERIRKKIAKINFNPDLQESLNKTVSIGVSLLQHGDTVRTLIGSADHAMYRAKHQGKNQTVIADHAMYHSKYQGESQAAIAELIPEPIRLSA